MGVTRWDPFRDLLSLQERMNKLFEDSIARTATPGTESAAGTWAPAVDIIEREEELVLRAEMAGVALDDIELQVDDDKLILRGERRFEHQTKKENYYRVERAYGGFSRSFTLPSIVDKAGIRAKLKDGILEVRLPKVKAEKSKSIPIQVKE